MWTYLYCNYHIPLSASPTKWSDTLKQFVGKLPTNCLKVFDHFLGLALKGILKVFEMTSSISQCGALLLRFILFHLYFSMNKTYQFIRDRCQISFLILTNFRNDTHLTSMKIVKFSRSPTPLSIYGRNSSTPLTLGVQFQTTPLLFKWYRACEWTKPKQKQNQVTSYSNWPRVLFFDLALQTMKWYHEKMASLSDVKRKISCQ